MEDGPCHQEMVALAAIGPPEKRNRLRDFINSMIAVPQALLTILRMLRLQSKKSQVVVLS